MPKQNIKFKTEVKQMLDIVINSLYSHNEIFLRELISNSSDAIDKLKFESLKNTKLLEGDEDWKIKIKTDKDAKTITISDNGIGMTKEDVISNLGTIAKSGTKEFIETLKKSKEANSTELIGQFGVGFYSSFMVAESVTVITKKAGTKDAILWMSKGDGSFSVEETTKDTRGTDIILKMKDDAKEYLEEFKIREIVKKYSDYIEHPIVMDVKDEKKKETKEETINSQKAIWLRSKSEIKEEEHNEFYKHISHDWNPPIDTIHYSAEGTIEFKALLYLPSKAPFDLFTAQQKNGLHLYIQRVFIMDDCKDLLPEYLRFVSGVVDSSDLPLNISRETLQYNPGMARIKKNLVSKILSTLKTMLEKDGEKYRKFYKEFGRVLKEGLHLDFENKDKLKELLLFESANNDSGVLISLKDYVEKMPKEQKEIYFITSDKRDEADNSPHLEAFKKKGYDVLIMTDPVDEWISGDLIEYEGKQVKSVLKGEIDLEDKTDKKEKKAKKKKFEKLIKTITEKLSENIKEVRLSNRLTDSACCLVADEGAMDARMERIMEAMNQAAPKSKRILEINPDHPLIVKMGEIAEKDSKNPILAEYADLLYDQSLLTEGSRVSKPGDFAKKISDLMFKQL